MNTYCIDLSLTFNPLNQITKKRLELFSFLNKHQRVHYVLSPIKKYLSEDLITFFQKYNLTTNFGNFFYSPPNYNSIIHSDFVESETHDIAKLIWVYDGEQSFMNWYSYDQKNLHDIASDNFGGKNHTYISYNCDNLNLIFKHHISKVSLAQVGIPHNVTTYNFSRSSVCIFLNWKQNNKHLTFNEAADVLKEFLILN
jgi:hypothetical protein